MSYRFRQLLALAREYKFVTACLITILVAGNVSLYFNQQNSELERIQTRLRREGEEALRTITSATTIRNDDMEIDSALKEIDASLVYDDNLAENLGYFYIIEDQTQTRIGDVRQGTALPKDANRKYKTVPITLSVTGSYKQVFEFLHKVETGPRLIKIAAFTLYRRQATGDAVTMTMDLEMLAYP